MIFGQGVNLSGKDNNVLHIPTLARKKKDFSNFVLKNNADLSWSLNVDEGLCVCMCMEMCTCLCVCVCVYVPLCVCMRVCVCVNSLQCETTPSVH